LKDFKCIFIQYNKELFYLAPDATSKYNRFVALCYADAISGMSDNTATIFMACTVLFTVAKMLLTECTSL